MHDSDNLKMFSWLFLLYVAFQTYLIWILGAATLSVAGIGIITGLVFNLTFIRARSRTLSAHLLNSLVIVWAVVLGWNTGGIYSISIFILILVPVFITLLENRTHQILYGVGGIAVFVFFAMGRSGLFAQLVPDTLVNISLFRVSNLAALMLCAGISIFMTHWRNRSSAALLEAARIENRRIQDEARTAMKIKDQFLANMSHEIRNPMNGIIGMMHVLLDSDLDEEQKKYSRIVYNSARALLSIVNDILDLSKIEAGKLEFDIRKFDLEIAIDDIVSLPEVQARQKGIAFTYTLAPDVPCLLKGDIGRIRQVLNNLTGNAVKFTDAGEVILSVTAVSEDEDNALIRFSVEDTGIGINEETLKSLFQSFTQADSSITKKYGGTGLGLAISKLLVEKMGGRIGVESIEMIGSTFWFELPLEKHLPADETQDPFCCSLDICKILVMSDGATLGQNFENNLEALGFEYEQAYDETEALEMLRWAKDDDAPFNIVILEAKESDIHAETLGRKIKEDSSLSSVRIMLLTSIGKKGDARRFEEIGFSAFLSKPVEESLLSDAIKAVLSLPETEAQPLQSIITKYSIIENKKQLRKILIVEDMETNLLTAKVLIGKLGYKTDQARNGEEAVKKVMENSYDLVLMDCQMPVMDGFEATRRIRQYEKEQQKEPIPIVAMTGNAFESDRKKCVEAGMNDFMAKPVEPEILSEKIHSNCKEAPAARKAQDTPESEGPILENELEAPAAAEQETASGPVHEETDICFNKEKLFERFGNDEELVEVILESFFQEAPELIEKITQAVDSSDPEAVRVNAHALKGSSANVNADLLKKAALILETAAKENRSDDFPAAFAVVQKEYNHFMKEAAP
jgi:two-component system sensor histidine kinase/response regulator